MTLSLPPVSKLDSFGDSKLEAEPPSIMSLFVLDLDRCDADLIQLVDAGP